MADNMMIGTYPPSARKRGILRRMARFGDMRKFAQFIKEEHLIMTKDKAHVEFIGNKEWFFDWPIGNEASAKFAEREGKSNRVVSDICNDCIAFNYLRYSESSRAGEDRSLIVTSKGRHLLLWLGVWRELAKDNSEWLNIATAFLAGIIAACVAGYFSVWVLHHAPPSTVVNNNYYQTPSHTQPKSAR